MKIFTIFFLLVNFGYATEFYTYVETVNGKIEETTNWAVDTKEENLLAIGKNENGTTILELTPANSLLSAVVRTKTNHLNYFRDGQYLKVQKVVNNKDYSKAYKIGNAPWIQRFEFGFSSFMKSNQKRLGFYVINPKDLTIYKLVAKKQNTETISIEGKRHRTQRVKITLPGFKSMFWDAQLWFDLENQDLLRYKTNDGPGTQTFTITLIDKSIKQV